MNRRSFLSNLVKAAGLFTILPPASTYDRIWKASRPEFIINKEWIDASYDLLLEYNKLPFYLAKNQIIVEQKIMHKNWVKFSESLNVVTYKFNQGEVIRC